MFRYTNISISFHANERLHTRNITRDEVINCISKGRVQLDGHGIDQHFKYTLPELEVIVAHRKDQSNQLVTAIRKSR